MNHVDLGDQLTRSFDSEGAPTHTYLENVIVINFCTWNYPQFLPFSFSFPSFSSFSSFPSFSFFPFFITAPPAPKKSPEWLLVCSGGAFNKAFI